MNYNAIDIFSGCGGLSEGLKQAGFKVVAGVEVDKNPAKTYLMNHSGTYLFEKDIRKLDTKNIMKLLKGEPLHLLAGCPPCQGFSSIRRLNRRNAVYDERNELINEYFRFIEELRPLTIMLENVPAIVDYGLFKKMIIQLESLNYKLDYDIVDVSDYGVPQRRKRLVLVGSKIGHIRLSPKLNIIKTVRDAIGNMEKIETTKDPIHKIFPQHIKKVQKLISMIPKNGGSRTDLPDKYKLECHKKENIGFNDVYGRLKWDTVSSTITGGCLNPSKGRFLHPEEDRCISAREASLLQTFPIDYNFPINIPKAALALLIGNALPPEFSRIQAKNIFRHIKKCYG